MKSLPTASREAGANSWLAFAVPAFFALLVAGFAVIQIGQNRTREDLRRQVHDLRPGYRVELNGRTAAQPTEFTDALLRFQDSRDRLHHLKLRGDQPLEISDGARRIRLRLARDWASPDEYCILTLAEEGHQLLGIVTTSDLRRAAFR